MKGGVAVRVNFRHDKGYRNPNKDGSHYSDARRTFLSVTPMCKLQMRNVLTLAANLQISAIDGRTIRV
jgi:hypothetical protein